MVNERSSFSLDPLPRALGSAHFFRCFCFRVGLSRRPTPSACPEATVFPSLPYPVAQCSFGHPYLRISSNFSGNSDTSYFFDYDECINLGLQVPCFSLMSSDGPFVVSGVESHLRYSLFDAIGGLNYSSLCPLY